MAAIHFSPFTCYFRRFLRRSFTGFNSMRTPNSQNHSYVHYFSSKTKVPGEEGAAGYCPKILLPKRAKMVLSSFHRSHRESAFEIGHFLRQNFWMISGGTSSPRPFCFTPDYSLSEFTGEWFTNRSNHIHIFTPITRIVATKFL